MQCPCNLVGMEAQCGPTTVSLSAGKDGGPVSTYSLPVGWERGRCGVDLQCPCQLIGVMAHCRWRCCRVSGRWWPVRVPASVEAGAVATNAVRWRCDVRQT